MDKRLVKVKVCPKIAPTIPIEIDYDKLADAIVLAQEKAKHKSVHSDKTKLPFKVAIKQFFISIWSILAGKKNSEGHLSIGLLAVPLAVFLKMAASIGIIVSVYLIFQSLFLNHLAWTNLSVVVNSVLSIIITIAFVAAILLYSILMWGAADEIERSDEKDFIFAMFSSIVAFAALITSIIALKK